MRYPSTFEAFQQKFPRYKERSSRHSGPNQRADVT
jgi:hypothetical protein